MMAEVVASPEPCPYPSCGAWGTRARSEEWQSVRQRKTEIHCVECLLMYCTYYIVYRNIIRT